MTGGHRPAGNLPAGRSPAHGFCDDEQTRRLLRSQPPRRALAWAGARLGGPVISARALRGGMSSAVHLLTVQDDGGHRRQAVLRRYVRHFTGPATAQQWTAAHPGTFVISLNDAAELARRHAARTFGAVSA